MRHVAVFPFSLVDDSIDTAEPDEREKIVRRSIEVFPLALLFSEERRNALFHGQIRLRHVGRSSREGRISSSKIEKSERLRRKFRSFSKRFEERNVNPDYARLNQELDLEVSPARPSLGQWTMSRKEKIFEVVGPFLHLRSIETTRIVRWQTSSN